MRAARRPVPVVLAVGLLCALAAGAAAPRPAEAQHPASLQLTEGDTARSVWLMTMGPGHRVWEKFGHNALWIHDPDTGSDEVYNWGIFDFAQEAFFARLLFGHMRYRVASVDLARTLWFYRLQERTVRVRRLRLTPEQMAEVDRMARTAVLPENRFYGYDPFRDNCSSRVRDLLDRALDGRLRALTDTVPTGTTYRGHTRRLLQHVGWAYAGIMTMLGETTDRPISAWEEMFLPLRMEARLAELPVGEGAADTVPLAGPPHVLHRASGPGAPASVPGFHLGWAAGGVAGGLLLFGLGALAGRGSRAAAGAFVVLGGLWSLLAGLLGALMVFGWAFTGHWYVYRNENLLPLGPLSLALVALLPRAVLGRSPGRWAARMAWAVAALAVIGVLIQPLPAFGQVNGEVLAMAAPLQVGLALGLSRARRGSAAEPSGTRGPERQEAVSGV